MDYDAEGAKRIFNFLSIVVGCTSQVGNTKMTFYIASIFLL
jgi:hypothetical protein